MSFPSPKPSNSTLSKLSLPNTVSLPAFIHYIQARQSPFFIFFSQQEDFQTTTEPDTPGSTASAVQRDPQLSYTRPMGTPLAAISSEWPGISSSSSTPWPKKKTQLLLGLFQKKDEVLADEQEAPQLFIMPFDALRCSRLLRSQKIWGHETALEHQRYESTAASPA